MAPAIRCARGLELTGQLAEEDIHIPGEDDRAVRQQLTTRIRECPEHPLLTKGLDQQLILQRTVLDREAASTSSGAGPRAPRQFPASSWPRSAHRRSSGLRHAGQCRNGNREVRQPRDPQSFGPDLVRPPPRASIATRCPARARCAPRIEPMAPAPRQRTRIQVSRGFHRNSMPRTKTWRCAAARRTRLAASADCVA